MCQRSDHLSLVANITRSQAKKLRDGCISTLAALAALQLAKRSDGENHYDLLPRVPGKGFNRLPPPNEGDIFFDIEGDPLFDDGSLEYLFGFIYCEPRGKEHFTAFWAHDRAEEKSGFERSVDLIVDRLAHHPEAHVYHYAPYEVEALKRLAMYHPTREAQIDDLLRRP